jgi:hypothetical protein
MGLGECILRTSRVVNKEWRPYCWMNENYDEKEPCTEPQDAWTCQKCPFRNKIKY